MKRCFVVLGALFVMAVAFVGCGDDDCATCNEPAINNGWVYGSLYLDPEAYCDYIEIHGYGAIPPNIDSVKIGDSLLVGDDYIDYDYDEDYHDSFWEIDFEEDGNESSYMFDHGDIATVIIYGEGGSSTCNLKILDADSAEAEILSPEYDADTLDSPQNHTTTWEKADGADYYAIMLEFRNSVDGSSDWTYYFDYTTDTTYTVLASLMPDSLHYMYVNVMPFTGPDPRTGASNWSGDWLGGKLYSFGWDDYVRIYGWNIPTNPSKLNSDSKIDEDRREWKPAEIINNVYDKF